MPAPVDPTTAVVVPGRADAVHDLAERAQRHRGLAEARQHVGDVGEVGAVRPDEQHAAAVVAHARIGVEQVRRPVQGDDGLPRARATVHDEGAGRARADDRVLVGLDGAEHVAHPR